MTRPSRPRREPEAGRRVISREPFNAETRLEALHGLVPPSAVHFVRSHFAVPRHPGTLTVDGDVRRSVTVRRADLEAMPAVSVVATIECAGNGRAYLQPPVAGEPWGLGAVGTAEWTGVSLAALLDLADVDPAAVEILFRGADEGSPSGLDGSIAYERSLPVPVPADAIVAYAMNGRPLARRHGAPFRLVVPGWYGMASVKWLVEIRAIATPFRGYYQADRYVVGHEPLTEMAPRALIAWPLDGSRLPSGPVDIRGYAWSGRTAVERVEVSLDGGSAWSPATMGPVVGYAWRTWELAWDRPAIGRAVLLARAIDARGDRQPLEQVRTELGYRNNAVRPVSVEIVARA